MTFADELRTKLQSEAESLDLHPAGVPAVVARSRRRQHCRRTVTGVAVVAALAVGGIRLAQREDTTSVSSGAVSGLSAAGPLDLSWQRADGGIPYGRAYATDPAAGTYALSTAPVVAGVNPADQAVGAVYHLGEDGRWAPNVLSEGAPSIVDVAAADGLLFGIGTAPASGGTGYRAVLSTSADGGASWAPDTLDPVPVPSTAISWGPTTVAVVESAGAATVAVVSTSFVPRLSELDHPAAAAVRVRGDRLAQSPVAEGFRLLAYPQSGDVPGEARVPEELGTLTWAQMGVSGRDALGPVSQVLVREDGGWSAVPGTFDDVHVMEAQVIGDEVVLITAAVEPVGSTAEEAQGGTGVLASSDGRRWREAQGGTRVLASSDGRRWREVPDVPEGGRLLGMGPIWVHLSTMAEGVDAVRVSLDRGASWQEVPLGDIDPRLAGRMVVGGSGAGPLGLALVLRGSGNDRPPDLAVTRDLVTWTVTPVADLVGEGFEPGSITVVVGADRVVVTATERYTGPSAIPVSRMAVGTPVRP